MNYKFLSTQQIEDMYRDLPPPLAEAEIRTKYGLLLQRTMKSLEEASRSGAKAKSPTSLHEGLANLLFYVGQRFEDFELRLGAGTQLLEWQPAHAAAICRGPLQPSDHPAWASFKMDGQGCSLRGTAQPEGTRECLNLSIEFCGHNDQPLRPFTLSLVDRDTGQTLLENRVFQEGRALLKELEPGSYQVRAESEAYSCEMSFEVHPWKQKREGISGTDATG